MRSVLASMGPPAGLTTTFVMQGCYEIANDPDILLSTVLGSCVAACIREPVSGIGGMNHFLLPELAAKDGTEASLRYGAHSMETLVNAVVAASGVSDRRCLEAKVFGGGAVVSGLSDVGGRNSAFVRTWLARDGLRVLAEDLGGREGRRVLYHPATGRAWCKPISSTDSRILAEQEKPKIQPPKAPKLEIELF